MSAPAIGVIGGTGLYEMEGLEGVERVEVETPFGRPSDAFVVGHLAGRKMVFLARHGVGHKILPSELNFRANIWAMKKLGAGEILSVSAVGSMKASIAPGHLVFVDQFIDRTRQRPNTFYGHGVVVHVPLADPVCSAMQRRLAGLARDLEIVAHDKGTYICIEGPQFSTRAESFLYRSWGVDVIGMTNMPEARLAREAEIHYTTIALATDYDCWHDTEEAVTVEAVMAVLKDNAEKAKRLIRRYVETSNGLPACGMCGTAARSGLLTPLDKVPAEVRERLAPIFDPIFSAAAAAGSGAEVMS